MNRLKFYLIDVLVLFVAESIAKPPIDVKACEPTDYGCVVATAQALLPSLGNGVPELGIDSLDPLMIDTLSTENDQFKLILTNNKIYGFTECKIIRFTFKKETSTINIDIECPNTGIGEYDLKGVVNSIDVYGKGNYKAEMNQIRYLLELLLEQIEKDGNMYWKIVDFDLKFELSEEAKLNFENLYDGDESKANFFLSSINKNAKETIKAIGGPLFKQMMSSFVDIANKIALTLPANIFKLE